MVRLAIRTAGQIIPTKIPNDGSCFRVIKHQCLSLLKLCSSINQLSQIHARLHVFGLHKDSFLLTELVRFCALSPSRHFNYARTLLSRSENSRPPSWNFLIRGYASSDSPREAIWVFREMRVRGVRPNKLTYPFVFKACAAITALKEGRQAQVDTFKLGLDGDAYVNNTLVHFYGSCRKISDARKMFDGMPVRTVVSWNSIIAACVENLWFSDGIEYFVKMRNSGFEPDETTMVVLLSACAELGNLSLGRCVHSQTIGRGLVLNCQLGTSLVDMYAKSGALLYAKLLFDRLHERNVWTCSAMILGLAQHGLANEALDLFAKMMNSSISPNYVTFLGVLSACSHTGLVQDGYRYFHEMEHLHGIKPMLIHYGAMVDVLGRAGRLSEAYTFIKNMPIEPDPIVWRTLLSACSTHGVNDDEGVGDKVRKRLLELEPRRSGNLVMVANMYAEVGMWKEAADVRRVMRVGRMKKSAGESCIELGGLIRRFVSGYDSEADYKSIYQLLDVLNLHMKMVNQ
ncbi:Pentatricopeptide repeat [Trema orientale]|uniref:Pentatricopeptide repeat n=1 Tax=Trema orientale TaxID=63057 RepID=A0A2P5AQF3_TREOI|nr:Pentatricopeptide repeat [Trema orientale]